MLTPNHILIDDRKSNIDEWRAAGGYWYTTYINI